MPRKLGVKRLQVRSYLLKVQSGTALTDVISQTLRLWRKAHLDYDQTKYVVEPVRRRLRLDPPRTRRRSVERLDRPEVERLIQRSYQAHSKYGLMLKTLFFTGTRIDEFVHLKVEDIHFESDPPQIHITHAKGQSSRYVPILPSFAQELQTHLQDRRQGYLFESNRHTHYSKRMVQAIITTSAREAGITKRVYPHLLRHSIATILLDSGQVPIDQVQKFLGHLQLSTTQIYAQTSLRALGENYVRALSGPKV
jgi:integrase/recombinase XerD